jgi:hypothetical protein
VEKVMPTEIITALISGFTTLLVSIGTWHFSAKKDREKQRDDIKSELIKYYEKNREAIKDIRDNDLKEIRDDISTLVASFQQKIAVIEQKIAIIENNLDIYSQKVEKHNNVIERVYHCEDTDRLLDERIKVGNHRLDDLEREVRELKK